MPLFSSEANTFTVPSGVRKGGKLEGVLYFETAIDEGASFHLAVPVQRPVLVELVAEVGGVAVTSQTQERCVQTPEPPSWVFCRTISLRNGSFAF